MVDLPLPCGPATTKNEGVCIAERPAEPSRKAFIKCRCARTGTRMPQTSSAMSCPADLTAFASGNGNRLKISSLTSTTTIWEAMTTLKRTFIVLDTTVPARICTDCWSPLLHLRIHQSLPELSGRSEPISLCTNRHRPRRPLPLPT